MHETAAFQLECPNHSLSTTIIALSPIVCVALGKSNLSLKNEQRETVPNLEQCNASDAT